MSQLMQAQLLGDEFASTVQRAIDASMEIALECLIPGRIELVGHEPLTSGTEWTCW